MKILVIGSSGMLGSQCIEFFSNKSNIELSCTCRKKNNFIKNLEDIYNIKVYENVDVLDFLSVEQVIIKEKPDLVINCAGAIKQKDIGVNAVDAININGLFPHQLASLASKFKFKLIFDIRGFWADEKHDRLNWSKKSYKYRFFKELERYLMRKADFIVTLTAASQQII